MKRAATQELENPAKREKKNPPLRPLTEKEQANLEIAQKMFDAKKQPDLDVKKLHPVNKSDPFWFYCSEHKFSFQKSMRQMVVDGFTHRICKQKTMESRAPHLKDYFIQSADGKEFGDITHGSNVKCLWTCENGHEFEETPKVMAKRGTTLICHLCHVGGKSLKTNHPELEEFFIKSAKGRSYDEIPAKSHEMCTWWCDKKLHEIQRPPKTYVKNKTHQCEQCT